MGSKLLNNYIVIKSALKKTKYITYVVRIKAILI